MFHALSLHNFRASAVLPRGLQPAQIAPLALASAALIVAVLANAPRDASAPPVSADSPVATLMQSADGSTALLQTAADGLRAELRAVPGVGAVEMRGLQTAGIEVRYSPSRLAHLGIRNADLLASVPAQAASPGAIAVRPDVAQDGPEAVADMPVRAGRHVMRLGDLAFVARTPLPTPVARLHRDGRPAVELFITPAHGEGGPTLDRRVAKALAAVLLPTGVEMK